MKRFLVALLVAPVLMAGTLTDEQAARAFGARETMGGLELSPDGKTLLYLGAQGDRGTSLNVVPLDTMTAHVALASSGDPESLRWCGFAGSKRIVCSLTIRAADAGVKYGVSRLIAVGTDGRGVKLLGQKSSSYDERIRQSDGSILDWLPAADGDVLMSREYVPEAGKIGSLIARRGGWPGRRPHGHRHRRVAAGGAAGAHRARLHHRQWRPGPPDGAGLHQGGDRAHG